MTLRKRLKPQQLKKMIRYRLVYNSLSLMPYHLAYKIVSNLNNLVFDEMADDRCAYEQQLRDYLDSFGLNIGELNSYMSMQATLRSRNELDAVWPYLRQRRSMELANCQCLSTNYVRELQQIGSGVIIVMSHYGRPVRASQYLASLGISHGLLTQTFDSNLIELDREEMTFRMLGMNNLLSVVKGSWFTLQTSMTSLYKALKAGQWVIVMCDLFESNERSQSQVPFLGGSFSAPSGIPRLAKKTGAKLIYAVGKEDFNGTVHVDFKPLSGDPDQGLQEAFSHLEQDINEHPWQWHHWSVMSEAWRSE